MSAGSSVFFVVFFVFNLQLGPGMTKSLATSLTCAGQFHVGYFTAVSLIRVLNFTDACFNIVLRIFISHQINTLNVCVKQPRKLVPHITCTVY